MLMAKSMKDNGSTTNRMDLEHFMTKRAFWSALGTTTREMESAGYLANTGWRRNASGRKTGR